MKTEIEEIITIVAKAINCDPDNLSETSGINSHPYWDSLGHIKIMATLEDKYGLIITEDNVIQFTNIKSIHEYINKNC